MKLALVTGGHRRLGAAIAGALAREGYALAIHGSHDATPCAALAEILARSGAEWHGFAADFTDPAAAEGLIPAVAARFGRAPDLLVNSAATFGQDGLEDVGAQALLGHYAVNCAAPVLLARAFAACGEAGTGARSIVNILDQRIDQPHGDQLSYTLSKMALAGFTQIAARTLAPQVRVNAVAPGLTIATQDYSAAQLERLAALMPLQCLSAPEEIAAAVVYLAGARAVTGQLLYVDGGAHLKSYPRDFMYLAQD